MSVFISARQCLRRTVLNRLFTASNETTRTLSSLSTFSSEMSERLPTFSVPPSDIRILAQPKEFYALLLDMIRRAKKRIFLSSLYIGSGETELVNALASSLHKNQHLTLHLQLDLNRSTRPGAESTAQILLPLLRAYPDRVKVYLFRSPSLRGLLAKVVPPRFNEGWGTWHAKMYGADNEMIISGANLNSNYFTDRRDRYISFTNHEALTNYCCAFLDEISAFSFRLLPHKSSSEPLELYSYRQEDYIVSWSGPHANEHPHYINRNFERAISSFQAAHQKRLFSASGDDIKLFPLIQGGQFNIRQEEAVMEQLFSFMQSSPTRSLLDLTSGYFNLYKPYQKYILNSSNIDCRIVAASPKANGFYGSRGISGRIPEGYTILERRFMEDVKLSACNVELNEWEKAGWTYHAKGLWLSDTRSDPVLTLFGSTNLNARSAHIDTELSFMMLVPPSDVPETEKANSAVRRRLKEEVGSIREHTKPWAGHDRKIRPATPMMLKIVENML